MTLQEVIGSFMADCRLRGLSTRTLEGYEGHLAQLSKLAHDYPPKADIIQEFLCNVNGGAYNRDAYYRTFNALGHYAHKRYGLVNFMKSVTRPKVPKESLPTITGLELGLIATFLQDAPLRDKAIMCLFIDCALRKGEASNLKREDIHEDRILVHGKTGYRTVPISGITRDLLLSLPPHPDGYVFHGEEWTRYKNHRLSSTGLYKIVRRYLRRAGYTGKHFGPQTLRRSFGVFHLKDGADLKSLSMILGHSNIMTTANYYTPLMTEDVIEIHHKHTPIKVMEEV